MDKEKFETVDPASPDVAPAPRSRDVSNEITPGKMEALQIANLDIVEKGAPTIEFSEKEKNAVIRKLDWRLMPLIFILYSLSVLDRSNLGNARLAGLVDDIDLSGRRYDWLATVFYIACEWQIDSEFLGPSSLTHV